jgi:ketosteroid isomerase-like protein
MNATVSRYLEAIDRKDAEGIRDALAPDVRMVGMAPDVFYLLEGADAATEKLAQWYASWGEEPAFSFLSLIQDGDRVVAEFERTSTFEDAPWVVRQAHVIELGPDGIAELRVYCSGPRQGTPELAAAYAGAAR